VTNVKTGLRDAASLLDATPVGQPPLVDVGLVRAVVDEPRQKSRRASLALRSLVPVVIFGLWWLLTGTGVIGATALSSPGATWSAFVTLLIHQDLMGDIGISVTRAGFGLLIGGGVGLIIGITSGLFTLGEELFDSTMQMVRTIPYPVLIFPFIIWFGIGETAKVLLIAYATLIPMYIFTFNGVRNVDRRVVEAARTFGLRGWRLVRSVVFPLALPSILNGLRLSAGVSVIALVFAETINANQGIGYLVSQASALQQVPNLVVCIFIYAILGILADVIVRIIERVSLPWARTMRVR
jgi:sulfonate transport system permease protein